MKGLKISLIVFFLIITIQQVFTQEIDTIYASYKYIMGDNDTKSEAKQLCFMEAKRLCLEQAGTYIESNVTVENYQVTKDEINTYAAAFVQVELISEEIENLGETFAIHTTVRAVVDPAEMQDYIAQVKSDAAMEKQLQEKEQERQNLEKNVTTLKERLQQATPEQRERLRQEMTQSLQEMDAFEKQRDNRRDHTRKALENIQRGMTPKQVVKVAGIPDKRVESDGDLRLNYGLIWVIFEKGKVVCAVKEAHFRPKLRCKDYSPAQKVNR
jgi:DNA repair exonuclease SbcCD ATPase subunit